jgi:2-C-methyl-D-erythritol 4-phosphate cytidylyltransferase
MTKSNANATANAPGVSATSPARIWALIPCAGSGSRSGSTIPKQYQTLAGQALVSHTLAAFGAVADIAATLVVLAPEDAYFETEILRDEPVSATINVANCGGSTRANSVFNGLNALMERGANPSDWVLVHDAARCLITPALIQRLIDACVGDAVGGLLALQLPDTLKSEAGGRVSGTIDRNNKWLAQTPQMFRLGALHQALEHALELATTAVTDESSAMEALGLRPKLVPGSAQNFKVTYPEDFALAQAILQSRLSPKTP